MQLTFGIQYTSTVNQVQNLKLRCAKFATVTTALSNDWQRFLHRLPLSVPVPLARLQLVDASSSILMATASDGQAFCVDAKRQASADDAGRQPLANSGWRHVNFNQHAAAVGRSSAPIERLFLSPCGCLCLIAKSEETFALRTQERTPVASKLTQLDGKCISAVGWHRQLDNVKAGSGSLLLGTKDGCIYEACVAMNSAGKLMGLRGRRHQRRRAGFLSLHTLQGF